MQSYFFPYISYFQLIDSVDTFIIYEYVSFRKKSWVTRNRILDKGKGEPVNINVQVIKQSSNKLIKDILLEKNIKWKKKNLDLIYFNYKKAKHFNEIYPFLEKLIKINEDSLHVYNSKIIIKLCEFLDIKTTIIFKNSITEDIEFDLQEDTKILKENKKSERILRLCNKYNATTYINPIGGTELYDKDYFAINNINLLFTKTGMFDYPQFNKNFIPYLSIIDLLMHVGVEKTKEMIKKYTLI
ncbi:WbqC family protein [Tenacibaculum sp. 1_MG-2023]|nr:WbqC family protein [Tenacibaculum sp. 1_MG-2023]MDO6598844.1 WbqC family protein [Tenacibaculum sp. 1_MG-2023]